MMVSKVKAGNYRTCLGLRCENTVEDSISGLCLDCYHAVLNGASVEAPQGRADARSLWVRSNTAPNSVVRVTLAKEPWA